MAKNVEEFLTAMMERIEKSVKDEMKNIIEKKVCDNLEIMINNHIISMDEAKAFAKSNSINFVMKKTRKTQIADMCGSGNRCSCTSN